jgi:cyclic pyranopterin phosphate synthase
MNQQRYEVIMNNIPNPSSPNHSLPVSPIFEYIRISVTDRCNLRCRYCMPEEGIPSLPHSAILQYEEMIDILKAGVAEGIHRVRLTGGEPLVRKGLTRLITAVVALPQIDDLALTTNGVLLEQHARALREAGLHRINISLDSLRPERYHQITRLGRLDDVKRGIQAALEVGLDPIKINVVLIPGENDDEILDFADLAASQPLHVRFIEQMPFGGEGRSVDFISEQRVLSTIRTRYSLSEITESTGGGPARMYQPAGGKGKIGFISPRSHPFCRSCTRLRLSSDGTLFPCLDSPHGENVRGKSLEEIRAVIQALALTKTKNGKTCAGFAHSRCLSLAKIGG